MIFPGDGGPLPRGPAGPALVPLLLPGENGVKLLRSQVPQEHHPLPPPEELCPQSDQQSHVGEEQDKPPEAQPGRGVEQENGHHARAQIDRALAQAEGHNWRQMDPPAEDAQGLLLSPGIVVKSVGEWDLSARLRFPRDDPGRRGLSAGGLAPGPCGCPARACPGSGSSPPRPAESPPAHRSGWPCRCPPAPRRRRVRSL